MAHLRELEAEAIWVMRETVAERERPVLLFSGGKDSLVLLRLAEKAFRPARFPFPLMHVDTGHNFPEVIAFRDERIAELGERLVVASVEESIRKGRVADEPSRNPVSSAAIQRLAPGNARLAGLASVPPGRRGHELAQRGLWYDAFDFFAALAQAHPEVEALRRHRDTLLRLAHVPERSPAP